MYKPLVGLAVLTLLAGCSSEWDPSRRDRQAAGAQDGDASAISDVAYATRSKRSTATSVRVAGRSGFATLPDRGELLRYDSRRPSLQRGAYTSYPVELSEEHAFAATRDGGTIQIQAPNGAPITLTYERHVEHPDGNWTWIGRDAAGQDAVLTFGERAVFGSVPNGVDTPFQLTLSGGRSVLVATDRSKIGDPNRAVTREGKPDFLVPPRTAAALVSDRPIASSAVAESVGIAAAASGVIDIVLGYTPGFASVNGGDSGAATRLAFLVDITNQAYVNSKISARLRLVRAVRVNYPDATNSATALEELTGYKNGGGTVPINAAFNELRAARDEYGGDLVSLVRAFRAPENDGCGIAWLIGGNLQAIQVSDAPFGYSVVSDGTDIDERDGNTYGCSLETLAHELGHNMGQAHNSEDSANAGTHAYSYGYRETSTTGFYTIMAYRLSNSSQTGIRYFANPAVSVSGRPTGVADKSDNARSMNQTTPIIRTFRNTVVPTGFVVPNDVNGDGRSDLVWRNTRTGGNAIWRSADFSTQQSITSVASQAWKIVGNGDFDGDGKADLVWRNSSSGDNTIWKSGASNNQIVIDDVADTAWRIVGVGDFNGDGKSDLLWRNTNSGRNTIWRAADADTQQSVTSVTSASWAVAGVGDFDGDGTSDVLWYQATSGQSAIWKSANYGSQQSVVRVTNLAWRIAGVGDFNGDGRSDILWRNSSSGANAIWLSGKFETQQSVKTVNTTWIVAAVGDYDGDGRSDIFWRSISTGSNVYWKAGNFSTQQSVRAVTDQDWKVQP